MIYRHTKSFTTFSLLSFILPRATKSIRVPSVPQLFLLFWRAYFAYPSYRTRSTSSYPRRNILKSMSKSGPPSEMESAYLCVGEWWPCMLSEPRCISSPRSWFAHRIWSQRKWGIKDHEILNFLMYYFGYKWIHRTIFSLKISSFTKKRHK